MHVLLVSLFFGELRFSGITIALYQSSAAFSMGLVNETLCSFAVIVLLGKVQWHFSKSHYKQILLEYL